MTTRIKMKTVIRTEYIFELRNCNSEVIVFKIDEIGIEQKIMTWNNLYEFVEAINLASQCDTKIEIDSMPDINDNLYQRYQILDEGIDLDGNRFCLKSLILVSDGIVSDAIVMTQSEFGRLSSILSTVHPLNYPLIR